MLAVTTCSGKDGGHVPQNLFHFCHKETLTKAHVKSHVTSLTEELDMALRYLAYIVYMVCSLSLLVNNTCEELANKSLVTSYCR